MDYPAVKAFSAFFFNKNRPEWENNKTNNQSANPEKGKKEKHHKTAPNG
ncbi:TPA: hypothetical protein IAD52_07600 [Candidatus Spyradomonas excrementavium]|nr:hypothetical protein [Candidatus Spyradomonas excrementavium]